MANLDVIPLWAFFTGTVLLVLLSIEVGHRSGLLSRRQSEDEKESPVSGVSGAIMGLNAFILAFTFSIVTDRHDARRALVREDANAIRLTYLRADFLPAAERDETRRLLRRYLDTRLSFVAARNVDAGNAARVRSDSEGIQHRLWQIAVANGARDMNSDIAAMYLDALGEMFAVDASRWAVGFQARIPIGVWYVLFGLTVLGMMSLGYFIGIAGSKRSKASVVLAVSFATVITAIAALDRPDGHAPANQQPLMNVKALMLGQD